MNILRLTKLVFLKRCMISLVGMWMLVLEEGNDLSIFIRSNKINLDVLHDKIKFEPANF